MPDDYNIPYQTIRELLASVGQPSPIKHRRIYMGDDVYSEHVMDLEKICLTLWNYINTNLGEPYIKDYDFQPLRSLLLSIPSIRFSSPLTPFEWNAIFDFCRRIIDLILRYPPYPIYVEMVMFE